MITLYRPNGTVLLTVEVDDDSYRDAQLMGFDLLAVRFSLEQSVGVPLQSYTIFDGRRYTLYAAPEVTKVSERQYDYVMTMYTIGYLLHITLMRNLTDHRLKFPFTETARGHLQMVCNCLNAVSDGNPWQVDYANTEGMEQKSNGAYIGRDGNRYADNGDKKLVCYEFAYCVDAVKAVADAFMTEYEVTDVESDGTHTYYVALHRVEYHRDHPLPMRYGRGGGFVSGIMRRNDSDMPPVDRLYIHGGEQNIPEHYGQTAVTENDITTYEGERSQTLLLPKRVACFYCGGAFYFSKNPTVRTTANGETYVQAKDYQIMETGEHVYEVLYDDKGNRFDYLLMVPTPCFLTSDDGHSLQRVRHTYYDPDYSPRGTSVEAAFDASEIYPMRVGGVNAVLQVSANGTQLTQSQINSGAEVYYDICDIDSPDLTNLCAPGETMTVIFQDGMLAGREFEIQTVGEGENVHPNVSLKTLYDSNNQPVQAWRIPLCQSDQDGIIMPKDLFVPAVGDHYVVFHCLMPEEYVSGIQYGAEYRALREMTDYLYRHGSEDYTFNGTVDGLWAKRMWDEYVERYTELYEPLYIKHSEYFSLGQHIRVTDVQLFGYKGLVMRVTGIRQYLNNPRSIELTLTNAVMLKFNWTKHLSETVEAMRVRPRPRPNPHIFPRFSPMSRIIREAEADIRGVRLVSMATVNDLTGKQNTDRSKINEVINSLYSANEVFLTIKGEFNKLRSTLLSKSLINQKNDPIVNELGLQHCTIDPRTGEGMCVASQASIGVPELLVVSPKQ